MGIEVNPRGPVTPEPNPEPQPSPAPPVGAPPVGAPPVGTPPPVNLPDVPDVGGQPRPDTRPTRTAPPRPNEAVAQRQAPSQNEPSPGSRETGSFVLKGIKGIREAAPEAAPEPEAPSSPSSGSRETGSFVLSGIKGTPAAEPDVDMSLVAEEAPPVREAPEAPAQEETKPAQPAEVSKYEQKALEENEQRNAPTENEIVTTQSRYPLYDPSALASLEQVAPPPDAVSSLPADRVAEALLAQKDAAVDRAGTRRIGSALREVITGHPRVRIEEISVSAEMLLALWEEPNSFLRTIMTQVMPEVDQATFLDNRDDALDTVMRLFNEHDILGLCEKTVNDEATTHTRIVRTHLPHGTLVHPAIAEQFNADFDGDQLKISFDPEAMAGAKDAMAYLIGTDGSLKIDPDFFAIRPWGGGFSGIKAQLAEMFTEFNPTDEQLNGLTHAIETSWKEGKTEESLKSMARWARSIGNNPGLTRSPSYVTGRVIQRIYDTNSAIAKATGIVQGTADEFGITKQYDESMASDEFPSSPIGFPRESGAGVASNMLDAGTTLNTAYGVVPGRNLLFRIAAGWAKMAAASDLISMGSRGAVTRKTFLDALVLQMSGIKELDEKTKGLTGLARRMIREEVGYPDVSSDEAFLAWVENDFIPAYNRAAFVINSAASVVRLNKTVAPSERYYMPVVPPKTELEKRNDVLRRQFRGVFGAERMGVVFDGKQPPGSKYLTVEEYVSGNRESIEFYGDPDAEITTIDQFIGRLADLRTSYAEQINKKLHGEEGAEEGGLLTKMMYEGSDGRRMTRLARLIQVYEGKAEVTADPKQLERDMAWLVQAYYFLGPEMMTYLGLDNPAGFEMSALGRRFLEVTSEDELLGVLYEAIASYRLVPIKELRRRYDQAIAAGDAATAVGYSIQFEAELTKLASSSVTWDCIVRAYKDGKRQDGKDIFDYVFFSKRGGEEIEEILNDSVRLDPLGKPGQQTWEIASDLYSNPKGQYANNRFIADFGHTELLDNLDHATDKMDNYGNVNYLHCVESVEQLELALEDGELLAGLQKIKANPQVLMDFRLSVMSDAIQTVLEKSFKSSEKAQQEAASNYLYTAVSYLMNAGVWSHMAYGGDFSVGKISLERFQQSPLILARLLTDPKYSVTVYSDAGEKTLSMGAIFGTTKPSEPQVYDWLKANPRAAMALRMQGQTRGVSNRSGSAQTTASLSLADTFLALRDTEPSVDEKAAIIFADNPGFYALAELTVAYKGVRRFQARDTQTAGIVELTKFMRSLISKGAPTKALVDGVVNQLFIDTFGAERASEIDETYKAGEEQLEDSKNLQEADDMRYEEDYFLGQIKDSMKKYILAYASRLAEAGVAPLPRMKPAEVAKLFNLNDPSTRRGYFDVEQTIIGVKTELGTAVEGAESRRLAPLMFLSYITPEPCGPGGTNAIEIDTFKFGQTWHEYIGLQAFVAENTWIPVGETTWQEIAVMAEDTDGIVRIEDPATCVSPTCACKRHATADQSTNFGGRQTPSFVRLLTIVRTLSAEKLNLKTKTQGNDNTDSVVKNYLFDNPLYNQVAPKITAKVNSTYQRALAKTGDPALAMAAARRTLAAHLQRVYSSMKYSGELSLNDYINVAHIMIREVPGATEGEPAQLKILAMGQISALVGAACAKTRAATPKATSEDYETAATSALLDLDRINAELDIDTIMAGFKVQREYFMSDQLISQRESSIGRNARLIEQIVDDTGVTPVSDLELDEEETRLAKQFENTFEKWRGVIGRRPSKWYPGSEYRFTYRVIGVFPAAGQAQMRHIGVGPRNVVVVNAKNKGAVGAIVNGYRYGVNVLVEGKLTKAQWKQVGKKTRLDERQGVWVTSSPTDNHTKTENALLLPMFDLRLNGRNTTLQEGAMNAGVVSMAPDDNLLFIVESTINEHGAGSADFVRTQMTDDIKHDREGVYRIKANAGFANLVELAEHAADVDPNEIIPQGTAPADEQVNLAIFGDESYDNYATLRRILENTPSYKKGRIAKVILGDLIRPDRKTTHEFPLGERWAQDHYLLPEHVTVDWWDTTVKGARIQKGKYGELDKNTMAGIQRNQRMAEQADRVVIFWDGKSKQGKYMREVMLKADGVEVMVVNTTTQTIELNGEVIGGVKEWMGPAVLEPGIQTCEVAPYFDVQMDILDAFGEGRFGDIPIDLGIPYVAPGGADEVRLVEGIRRFRARADRGELGEDGLLPTARPGEIIGFMRAELGDEVRYHPIRPFEHGNEGGAPTSMEIESVGFDEDTGEILVKWAHRGTMAGRWFKIFEDGNASAKFIARAEAIADVVMEDGTKLAGIISTASTNTRRLLMRRQQKMLTLVYKARTAPWGYNLAEVDGVLPKDPDLKEAILTGATSIGLWKKRLDKGSPIQFIADAELNALLNYMADRCMRYGVDPTVLFASYHHTADGGKVPNHLWFNYLLVLKSNQSYMSALMRLMHLMNPELCPDGIYDTSGVKTFFDRNLQVRRPVYDENGKFLGWEMCDMFAGWHFLDDHYYGYSGSGTRVSTYSVASLPAMMAGGKRLAREMLDQYLDWANIGRESEAALPGRFRSADQPDDL